MRIGGGDRERMQLNYCKRQLPYAVRGVTRLFLKCRFEHSDTGALIVFRCRRQRNHSTTISCLRDLLLVPHRRSPPLPGLIVSSLGLAKTLLEDLRVLVLPCISVRTYVKCGDEGVDVRQHPWKPPRDGA